MNNRFQIFQTSTPIGGNLNGYYLPYEQLHPTVQNYVNNYSEGMVLVREVQFPSRTTGTLWYRGEVLGFTVEDVVRNKKIKNITAIPDTSTDDKSSLGQGAYYLNLRTTTVDALTRNYITFPNDNDSSFRNPGVFPNLGEYPGGSVKRDNMYFSGVRIHSGKDETWSSGCILFGRTSTEDGILSRNTNSIGPVKKFKNKGDIEGCQLLTRWIYDTFDFEIGNRSCRMMVINHFEFPIVTPKPTSGLIVDSNSKSPIKNAKIEVITKPTQTPPESPKDNSSAADIDFSQFN